MLSNEDIIYTAMHQSALDIGADAEDFLDSKNIMVKFQLGSFARKYYREPISCTMVSYGNNIVAATKPEYTDLIRDYINAHDFYHCFETPTMHLLDEQLLPLGQRVCFMAEYFLPDTRCMQRLSCPYELKVLTQPDFQSLYLPQWSNALCEQRKELDVLGVGAYDNGQLIGLAACAADCNTMWQIGVDVLPEYRQRGVAAALTSNLAFEILNRDKVPFYCCAWSNIRSAKNAIKSGFRPAWVEMTVKPISVVNALNHPKQSCI